MLSIIQVNTKSSPFSQNLVYRLTNLDIILVLCIASITVNNQLFVSLTQEKCTVTQNSVLNHRAHYIKGSLQNSTGGWPPRTAGSGRLPLFKTIATAQNRRLRAVNRQLSFKVIPNSFDNMKLKYFRESKQACQGDHGTYPNK